MRQLKPFHKNKKWSYFLNMSILITNSLNVGVTFGVKGDFIVLWDYLSRYTLCWFHIFNFFMDFLKFLNCSLLSFSICNPCYQCVLQIVQLLVVELTIFCKNYCLIKKNKNYWSIYKSIFNSPIGFDIVLTTLRLR